MNVFKRGRKAKDDGFVGAPPSTSAFKPSKTLRRKNKNVTEEEKPEFDLSSALPETKDFRTSLLMPGLSARFSMLREQDDPNTKVGKASDDSVLFPKRASRLNLFAHNPNTLADIDEVESIRSSIRPPFADRSNSFGDGYDSDGGSIMTRARRGEGNNLFGGRQKLYRIPTTSTRSPIEADSGSMSGRHVYEHDVSLSLFQQYRLKEREGRGSDEENRDPQIRNADDNDSLQSPAAGSAFSKNRGTQSSTASGRSNLRTSTAATSVASESPVLSSNGGAFGPKYVGKGYSETPNRANNTNFSASPTMRKVQDDGARPTRQLSHSKSAANMRDKSQRVGVLYSTSAFRPLSPPLASTSASAGFAQPLDFGFNDRQQSQPPARNAAASPTSPSTGNVDMLANSVQPNDRGKATALGLFNKPAKEFDENQYTQRQLQMHEGRNSPLQPSSRSTSREEARRGWHHGPPSRATPSPVTSMRANPHQALPVSYDGPSPVPSSQRSSGVSNASSGRTTPPSRSQSKSSASIAARDNVKARVNSLIRRQNAELAALEDEKLGTDRPRQTSASSHGAGETFFDNEDSGSSSTTDDGSFAEARQSQSSGLTDGDIHPAFRTSLATSSRTKSLAETIPSDESLRVPPVNSSTTAAIGLGGLIRTHLRHDSDKSSIYPPPSPRHSYPPAADRTQLDTFALTGAHFPQESFVDDAQLPPTSDFQKRLRTLGGGLEGEPASSDGRWQDEFEKSHKRGDSSATTKERREFDAELAERRRRIQEGLKSVTERDRSASPAAAAAPPPVVGREHRLEAFIQPKTELQPKAAKMLGIDLASPISPSEVRPLGENRRIDMPRNHGPPPEVRSEVGYANSRTKPDRYQDYQQGRSREISSTPQPRYGRGRSNSSAAEQVRSRSKYRNETSPPALSTIPMPNPVSPVYDQSREQRDWHNLMGDPRRHMASPTYDANTVTSPVSIRSPVDMGMSSMGHTQSMSQTSDGRATPQQGNGRTTPNSGKSSPFGGSRKRSGTRTQISSPTFISSTASVPLVPLPHGNGAGEAPPLPEMNPRRRGTIENKQHLNSNMGRSTRSPLESVPGSPGFPPRNAEQMKGDFGRDLSRPGKLRKSSSEGGSMAARARHQAMTAEASRQHLKSPIVPVFPNRSATTLAMDRDGGMF